MTVYLVNGPGRYREHDPGDLFETDLPPDVEARAIAHGTISIIEPGPPGIQPGSYTPPVGWHATNQEPPRGVLSLRGARSG